MVAGLVTSCASGSSGPPPSDGQPSSVTAAPSPTDDAEADAEADDGASVGAPEESSPDDTVAATDATDTDSSDGDPLSLSDVCETLRTAGFESRVDAVSRFESEDDDAGASLVDECGEDLSRLEAARSIRADAADLEAGGDPVAITDVRCANGEYRFVAENTSDIAIGVHVAFRVFADQDEEPTSSANYPIVIWSLDPGSKQGITGDFDEPDSESYRCNLSARVFVADTSAAGAGIPGVTDDDRTGDDPTEWIGALLEDETLAIGSGDIDAAASTEDLRSLFYDDVFEATQANEGADRLPSAIRICSATVDQPDPDRMSFVYFITYSDGDSSESFFRHGLFRRGADGQWRWLSAAQYFQSEAFADCAQN